MDGYSNETYGERIASNYDRLDTHADADLATGGPDDTAAFLAELVGGGRALELAIGTGRIALPLAARGVEVVGIDSSPAMVDQLRAKPGGTDIDVSIGDFTDVDTDGPFDLIYLVFNTVFILPGAAAQARCFANVATRLAPGGAFVIEAFVPDLDRFVANQTLRVRSVAIDEVFLDASIHHPDQQRVDAQHIIIREDGIQLFPVMLHYAWPAELDDMAERAGLRLRARYQDWRRTPFTESSGFHISVYEPA